MNSSEPVRVCPDCHVGHGASAEEQGAGVCAGRFPVLEMGTGSDPDSAASWLRDARSVSYPL